MLIERLESHFTQLNRDRGKHYFHDGRVTLVEVEDARVVADVQCSKLFRVIVELSDDEIKASCHCRFARAGQCKHMWAALLAAADQLGGDDEGADARDPDAYDPELPLYYVVEVPKEEPTIFRSRASKSRANTAVMLHQGPEEGPWTLVRFKREDVRELTDEFDRQLLPRLFGVTSGRELDPEFPELDAEAGSMRVECSSFSLDFEGGAELAKRLCFTERFHLQIHDDPPTRIEWAPATLWELGLRVEPPRGEDFVIRGFLRHDEERLELQQAPLLAASGVAVVNRDGQAMATRFDARGHFAWAEKLLATPEFTMSAEEQGNLIAKLVEDPCEPRVELPEEWTWTDEKETPRPVLHLRSVDGEPARRDGVACRLFFEYRGRRVEERHDSNSLCDEDRKEIYRRDPEAEDAIRVTLRALPIEIVDPPSGHFDYKIPTEHFHEIIQSLVDGEWTVEARERKFRGEGKLDLKLTTGIDWFELQGHLDFGDQVVPIADVLAAARKGDNTVRLEDGTAGLIPAPWLTRFRLLNSMGTARKEEVRFRRSQGWMLDALLAEQDAVQTDEDFEKYRERLKSFQGVKSIEETETFEGTLRDYQRDGLGWVQFLREFGFGGCLADDMGLGKTVQVLAHLERLRVAGELNRPTLVVCPNSVVYNWIQETERFAPALNVVSYTGPQRSEVLKEIGSAHVVVTTYGVLRRDILDLKEIDFEYVVLDEAQAIKNSSSQTAKCSRLLQGRHRLALSGTPIENRLLDIWSIFEFLNPGMLGSSTSLKRVLTRKTRGPLGEELSRFLASALQPFLLRRTKEQVANELPEKTELTLYCEMEDKQRGLYDQLLLHYRETLLKKVDEDGIGSTRMHVLEALLRLRQAACHPALVDKEKSGYPSCKLDTLIPLLHELRSEGHKALVFSQFTSYLSILRRMLEQEELPYEYLDGQVRDRKSRVERFQNDPDVPLFLISLKAGGLGLNLTAADYVYILDPWWNPAVEAQAIDRAHRIGQTRHVFAYRLICRNTVEEKILQLQDQKRALAEAIIRADNTLLSELTRDDLERLLS